MQAAAAKWQHIQLNACVCAAKHAVEWGGTAVSPGAVVAAGGGGEEAVVVTGGGGEEGEAVPWMHCQ